MITPENIRKKSISLYHRIFLNASLHNELIFPLIVPSDRGKTTDDFSKRYADLDKLLSKEKSQTGYGYTVEMKEVKTRNQGSQSVPAKIFFQTQQDFLKFLKKETEFNCFNRAVALIHKQLPDLIPWIYLNPVKIIDHLNDWPDLITVCNYFKENPRPDLYIRELPMDVHTKFIETHVRILKELLDFLLPESEINLEETKFEKRYGLKHKPPLIRFRILDDSIGQNIFQAGITDISLPVLQFANINLACRNIFIVENEMNFLTFPEITESMVIWGKGFAVESLKEINWLNNKNIIYWGDIDPQGFQILSMLRSSYPKVKSLMMDNDTYLKFQQFAVKGKVYEKNIPQYLSKEEKHLFQILQETPEKNRLEQEKISHQYAGKTIIACVP